jgi:hypothetical protein
MKVGYSLPIALALFALSLIYRLDGTNRIHPSFAKLGFAEFPVVMQEVLMGAEIAPVFPVISGPIDSPRGHWAAARGPSVEIRAIVGEEATLPCARCSSAQPRVWDPRDHNNAAICRTHRKAVAK